MILDAIFGTFSHDIGIDLGTANTLVYVKGKGIVIREPSVVALNKKTNDILAIGVEAKRMVGKTPAGIVAVRPLRHGVVSDFEVAERMLTYFIKKVHETPASSSFRFPPKIPRPRVVLGVPSSVTEVERKAVSDAALSAGARRAYLIEEPMAAAIGAPLPVEEPKGNMVIDIGGGTCEIAIISLGGIVVSKSLQVAGDNMDNAIVDYVRKKFNLLLGERTAEVAKIEVGSATAYRGDDSASTVVRGRDLKTGLPKSMNLSAKEVREALKKPLNTIIRTIKDAIEETPPELISDVLKSGITMAGGGSLLTGIEKFISEGTKIPVRVAKDPLTCVVRGCGKVLDNIELLEKVKVV